MTIFDYIMASLLEPNGRSAITEGIGWVGSLLFGNLAVILCVLSVAFAGMLLLTGRLAVRKGFHVALGCFLLLGAPIIASVILSATGGEKTVSRAIAEVPQLAPRDDLPPADYNPYAQASVRDDR